MSLTVIIIMIKWWWLPFYWSTNDKRLAR